MACQTTKRLICLWKDCECLFEDAQALQEHVTKHVHEQMQTDLGTQQKDDTGELQQDEPFSKEAKLNKYKMSNEVDNGRLQIVFLALEVWTDILGFVKRIQLARTVSLTNRRIHQICWPRLHGNKVEAYQIRQIIISARERFDRDRQPKAIGLKNDRAMPIPCCLVPSYITGFGQITVKFLDQKVLAFLTHILPCLAKSEVKICLNFTGTDASQCALVDQLLNIFRDGLPNNKLGAFCPLLSNIQYLPDIDNKLQKIYLYPKVLDIPMLMKMLASPRPDEQQRVIYMQHKHFPRKMLKAIKEDFRSSTQRLPQPFYMHQHLYRFGMENMQRSTETNAQTDEQLTIMPTTDDEPSDQWVICRHPRGQHEQWAEDGRERIQSASSNATRIHVDLDNA